MSPRFRNCSLDQPFLMSPCMHDWLPKEHLARFIADITDHLNLKPILDKYSRRDNRGAQAYHPLMLVRLLLYGYCTGIVSSRELERANSFRSSLKPWARRVWRVRSAARRARVLGIRTHASKAQRRRKHPQNDTILFGAGFFIRSVFTWYGKLASV